MAGINTAPSSGMMNRVSGLTKPKYGPANRPKVPPMPGSTGIGPSLPKPPLGMGMPMSPSMKPPMSPMSPMSPMGMENMTNPPMDFGGMGGMGGGMMGGSGMNNIVRSPIQMPPLGPRQPLVNNNSLFPPEQPPMMGGGGMGGGIFDKYRQMMMGR